MKSDETLALLTRENPVHEPDLSGPHTVDAQALKDQILLHESTRARSGTGRRPRSLALRLAAVGAAAAATVAAVLTIGSPSRGPGVENASAAFKKAAALTAASAERSGTAIVRITHDGEVWAGMTIRWHGEDLSLSRGEPQRRGHAGSQFLLVDGAMYGIEDGEWVNFGSPESIDPGSGTTPAEYLVAVRQDVGGATLRRVTQGMTGLTTSELDDGSTVYSGSVAAGLIARESGFKEGQAIRVLPFGYVAHDEAADPAAPLDVAVTVGADGIVREITVTWGTWMYSVAYSGLGETPAPVAPENARDLLRERLAVD
jgi:hypothetical protein